MRKIFYLSAILALLAGCTADKQDNGDTGSPEPAQSDYAASSDLYEAAARKLVGEFSKDLKGELMAALAEADAAGALDVCQKVAPAVADSYSVGGWTIRRVSEKFRNPDNRADTTELRILAQFADSTRPVFLHNWTETDSGAVYTYYQPIRTMGLCLKCHGDMQTLAPGVYQRLRKLYPLDRATGYKADELRGMFVVRAEWPVGEAYAVQFLAGSTVTRKPAGDSVDTAQ